MIFFLLLLFLPLINSIYYQNQTFIDSYQRQTIFHGVNVVYKGPPWHPSNTNFNPTTSFADDDTNIKKFRI